MTKGCSEDLRKRLLHALRRWDVVAVGRTQEELQAAVIDPEASHIRAEQDEDAKPDEYPEPDAIAAPPTKKQRGGHALVKTETLGENPRARRAAIRATLRQGYYVCLSGKRGIRTLHRLGACYALPDVDYLHYEFVGGPRTTSTILSAGSARGPRQTPTRTLMPPPRRRPHRSRVWIEGQRCPVSAPSGERVELPETTARVCQRSETQDSPSGHGGQTLVCPGGQSLSLE